MRRPLKNRNIVREDISYGSKEIEKFINYIMWDGKKNAARDIVYGSFVYIKEKTGQEGQEVFAEAIKNTSPLVEVRSRRIGGANYQVPREVRPSRQQQLSYRWIIAAARSKKGEPMIKKLGDELILAAKNEGSAVKKREDTHKMAEANKAFAHFAW
ncbi:MAG: small subunit ribosomal protein [Patescibacteria group bacterium]|nr:small subunit ribosomal protein [Patescibacteria group bacterium]